MSADTGSTDAEVINDTRRWVQRAVIGLNLCPFAKSAEVRQQVHYAVSRSSGFNDLLADLTLEIQALAALADSVRDTTLFIVPCGLSEFLVFTDFLAHANRLLAKMGYDGVFQIASLHPDYQFGDSAPDDITNHTNRSPYPTLHLLRESSIDRAVQAFPNAQDIFEANKATMVRIGLAGWTALGVGAGGPKGTEA